MLNRDSAKDVAKMVAELWFALMAMQGILYYLWVPLDWPSLLLVGLILSVAQTIRVIRRPRTVATISST